MNLIFQAGQLISEGDRMGCFRAAYFAFDILGRVTSHKQTTDGNDYTTGYTYSLSGQLLEQTYPSGRVVKNSYDAADGSLSQVQSKRSAETYRNFANGFITNAAGAVTAMRLGNGKWENTVFNSRMQPTQIGLGNGVASQNLLKLAYSYDNYVSSAGLKRQYRAKVRTTIVLSGGAEVVGWILTRF